MLVAWSSRLGMFLSYRIWKAGEDSRFVKMRNSPKAMGKMWFGQAVWVLLAGLPVNLVNTAPDSSAQLSWTPTEMLGVFLFSFGFLFETIADFQKLRFRSNPDNKHKFIQHGLWSLSRHPNYFGEICLQLGIYLFALSSLSLPLKAVSGLSPLLTILLLTRVSGIPLLEKQALARWGDSQLYKQYLQNTPLLIPFFGRK
eukprot:TRINITY_DN6571_c0_g1_i2.p1 TRINITY_DN6571_c0_g1~~TRINITY_DN6571_c0_g1_i2.p1  ORF type:complete len:199 (-),score=9.03 TRINITY_DN6571_c0_g1_i2:11-607(-)